MTTGEDLPPALTQNVTAVSGFAYGVIGADIHVFSGGPPLYLLANWQAEPKAEREWLRELPSRMLNARRAVVPFTGRDAELASLREWRDGSPQLAVQWMHGPGGQGKTRLAVQFAAESAAAGWKVIAAFHGPDADPPEPGSQDMRLEGSAGLLMIVDYADRWLATNLTWLFKNVLLHRAGVATRVLMVARTADAWPAIRAILDTHQAAISSMALPALAQESGERGSMFNLARDSFGSVYQLPGAAGIGPAETLDDPEFGLTLAVHMAALVAVDASARGQRPPQGMAGLTMYLLDREQLHWRRLHAGTTATAPGTQTGYRTPPEVMNQAVFTAALTGSVAPAVGAAVLDGLQLTPPDQILDDHAACYPPPQPGRAVLEPLYPDRLAEDFLALTVPGHAADYPAQPWAAATTTTLLARHGDQQAPAAWTPRAVTFLASAAYRWPHLGPGCLYRLLLDDPQLGIDAGNAALTAIADLPGIDPAILEVIEARFPAHRHVDLDTGIAAITSRLTQHQLARTEELTERSRIYLVLGARLHNAGRYREALAATAEAVQALRRLAATAPAVTPRLADALNILSTQLSGMGRPEEALTVTEEAVRLYRQLSQAAPEAFEHGLASALSNLGVWLSLAGQSREALAASEEAAQLLRRAAAANRGAEATSAAIMETLGRRLADNDRLEEALAVTEEALEIRRRLAAVNPAAFDPDLAQSLNSLSIRLSKSGHFREALPPAEEAVQVIRRIAEANHAFKTDLAAALTTVSLTLYQLERLPEALDAAEEAVKMFRPIALQNPALTPHLARLLDHLSDVCAALGRSGQAQAAAAEALEVRRSAGSD